MQFNVMQVEERAVDVDELLEADEVFCTGTAVVVSPVGSITYKDRRYSFMSKLSFSYCINTMNFSSTGKFKCYQRIRWSGLFI